jgi:hypothetical protein
MAQLQYIQSLPSLSRLFGIAVTIVYIILLVIFGQSAIAAFIAIIVTIH